MVYAKNPENLWKESIFYESLSRRCRKMNDEGKHEKGSREKAETSVQVLSSKSMLFTHLNSSYQVTL